MNNYQFDLVFRLRDVEEPEQYLDALFNAGCDDASPSIGCKGYISLQFCREDKNAIGAIRSAIKNVITAIPHAEIESIGPYLLNLSELAFEFEFTKQNMQKYASGNSAVTKRFPSPFLRGKISYWRISDVAQWLKENNIKDIEEPVIEVFNVIRAFNLALEKHRSPYYDKEIKTILNQVA